MDPAVPDPERGLRDRDRAAGGPLRPGEPQPLQLRVDPVGADLPFDRPTHSSTLAR